MPRWYLNFNNDNSFYDILPATNFLPRLLAKQQLTELATLRNQLLGISSFKQAF